MRVLFTLTVTYAECHKKAPYAECHYAECRYAECRGAIFLLLKSKIFNFTFTMQQV
jgi:hypothetical protein